LQVLSEAGVAGREKGRAEKAKESPQASHGRREQKGGRGGFLAYKHL